MPLPLLAWGAIALAGYGVKKGVDAKNDFDSAKSINHEAEELIEKADKRLNNIRMSAQNSLESFGTNKAECYENTLKPFKRVAEKIKNIDLSQFQDVGNVLKEFETNLQQLKAVEVTFSEIAGGGTTASMGGAAAGLAAYGGVQALAAASTGTAISSLGGVAATNATLAWLGGGSLAAGGGGMAMGTAVLGGVVAGPILAIGGSIMASKAEEALDNSLSNYSEAEAIKKEKDIAYKAVSAIRKRTNDLNNALINLDIVFEQLFSDFEGIVSKESNYQMFSEKERALTGNVFLCAGAISAVLNKPLLDEDGAVTKISRQTLKQANDLIKQLNSI